MKKRLAVVLAALAVSRTIFAIPFFLTLQARITFVLAVLPVSRITAQERPRFRAQRRDAGNPDAASPSTEARASEATAGAPESIDPQLEAFRRAVQEGPFTEQADDPIGLDARDEELRTLRLPEPEEIVEEPISPREGAVLTAIPGVREVGHTIEIELRDGIAITREELRFTSSARLPAEVRYRLAVPDGAALVALEVCAEAGCRIGWPERYRSSPLSAYDDAARGRGAGERALPIAHAQGTRDERGEAIVVRAAPVLSGREPLVVRVTWALRTPVRGGQVRFVVPARGADARVGDAEVRIRAIDVVAPAIDGVPSEQGFVPCPSASRFAVTATLPLTGGVRASTAIVPCSAGRCMRLRALAGRPQVVASDVILAIDVSPSTVASARGRIAQTARAFLAMLPSRARVRVLAFAARAEEITRDWSSPTTVDAVQLERAVDRDLGSATRFEAIWALASGWAQAGTRIVILGDGGLTASGDARNALRAAREAGVLVASVNVADRPSTPALREAIESAEGLAIDAGIEAEEAAAGRSREPLEARLSPVLAPVVVREVRARIGAQRISLGSLRAGEEIVFESALTSGSASIELDGVPVRAAAAPPELAAALEALVGGGSVALVAVDARDLGRPEAGSCSARGPYATSSAVVPRNIPLALAHRRRCDPPPSTNLMPNRSQPRSGIPARILLASLRRRVMPRARACFRDDRRGRPDYEVRAPIRIELEDREIAAASVEGTLSPELRRCLLDAIDQLEVPGFEGRVIVRWTLYTAPVLPPPVIELAPSVAEEVDRVAVESH